MSYAGSAAYINNVALGICVLNGLRHFVCDIKSAVLTVASSRFQKQGTAEPPMQLPAERCIYCSMSAARYFRVRKTNLEISFNPFAHKYFAVWATDWKTICEVRGGDKCLLGDSVTGVK